MTFEIGVGVTLLITLLGDFAALVYTALIVRTSLLDRFLILRSTASLVEEKTSKLRSLQKRRGLVLLNVFLSKPLIAASGLYAVQSFIRLESGSWSRIALELGALLVISDASFYFLHRWMHRSPFLFRKIHVVHHRATRPLPLDYMYEHPIEIMIENTGTFAGILILGHVSFVTLWLFGLLRVIHAVHTHSGVEFKKLPGVVISGSEPHDLHHFRFNGNYALLLKVFDRMWGTELPSPRAENPPARLAS